MPIDFNDLLDSLRADGKLVLTRLMKAVPGKHVIQDVRDGTDSVEFDVEDENEASTTITIMKAGGSGFHFTNGVPIASLGNDTDKALNYAAGIFYEKVAGAWVSRYTDQTGMSGGVTLAQALAAVMVDGSGLAIDRTNASQVTITIPNNGITPQQLNSTNARTNGYIYGTVDADTGEWIAPPPRAYSDLTGMVPLSAIPATIARLASPALTGTPTTTTPVGAASGQEITNAAWVLARLANYAASSALAALAARVTALENAMPPTPHSETRYAALRPSGAVPANFTVADFQGAMATSSTTQDIYTPASNTDMVVGIAVPMAEGPLTAVAEIDADGMVNQFANAIRGDFLPAVGSTEVTLTIDGQPHYIYCTQRTVRSLLLGEIGYRLTQTAP